MTRRAFAHVLAAFSLVAISLVTVPGAAQIFTTRGDVEAESRIQWLELKRNRPEDNRAGIQRLAQCVAFDIIRQIPEEFHDLDWEVVVFDDDMKNAFVTLYGKVAVFSGILEEADTPDMLAAILGHEVAHLTENHISERVNRGRLTGLVGAVGNAVSGIESRGAAEVLVQLPFQRGQELEADLSGMMFMARAGYNPSAAIELWRRLGGGSSKPGEREERPPEWLTTHPDPEFRMTDIARNLAPALVEYNKALDAGIRPNCSWP